MGTGRDGSFGCRRFVSGFETAFLVCVAKSLARRGNARSPYRAVVLLMEGESSGIAVVLRACAQGRDRTRAAHSCRSASNFSFVPIRPSVGVARNMVAALRSGHHHGRFVLGAHRSDHGNVLYGAWWTGGTRSGVVGQLVFSGRLRRIAYRFRSLDREEARWVGQHHRRTSTRSLRRGRTRLIESMFENTRRRVLRNCRNWIV